MTARDTVRTMEITYQHGTETMYWCESGLYCRTRIL